MSRKGRWPGGGGLGSKAGADPNFDLTMDIRTFRYAKGELWQRLVYVAVILVFVVLAVSKPHTGERQAHAGWFPVVVLVALGLWAFRGLYDRRPVLTFSGEGVWFAAWNLDHPIAWGDIQKVKYTPAARGEPWITLLVTAIAAERYGRQEFRFRTSTLDVKNARALELVEAHLSAARQKA